MDLLSDDLSGVNVPHATPRMWKLHVVQTEIMCLANPLWINKGEIHVTPYTRQQWHCHLSCHHWQTAWTLLLRVACQTCPLSLRSQPGESRPSTPGCWQPVPWCFTTGQWFCNRRLRVLKDRAAFSAIAQAERLRLSGVFVLTGTPTLVDSPVTVSGGVTGTQRRSLAGQHKHNTYLR